MAKYLDEAGLQYLVGKLGTPSIGTGSNDKFFTTSLKASTVVDRNVFVTHVSSVVNLGKWQLATGIVGSDVIVSGFYNDDYIYIGSVKTQKMHKKTENEYTNAVIVHMPNEEIVEVQAHYEIPVPVSVEHSPTGSATRNSMIKLCNCMFAESTMKDDKETGSINLQKCVGLSYSSKDILKGTTSESDTRATLESNVLYSSYISTKAHLQMVADISV